MSSKIARPNSIQSMTRTVSLTTDPFVCHRVSSPIKRPSDSTIKVGQKVYVSSLSLAGTVNGLFVMASKVKVIEQAKPTRSISRSPTMPLKPTKSTKAPTMKSTKSTAITLKSTKSTATPLKSTRSSVTTLKSTKSTATPHIHRSSRPTASPKSTKSAVTVGTLKSTKSTAISGTLRSAVASKPTKSTAVLRTSSSVAPRPKSTPPEPRQTKSPNARPTIHRAQSSSPQRNESPAPKMVRSQTEPEDMVANLLSAKESYALQVQEKNREIVSLKHALETSQTLQHRLARETEAAHARASLTVQTEQHVDRLEQRVQGLLNERAETQQRHGLEKREWVAYGDQLKKQLADRDHALATAEKEYATLCIANEDLIRSYERAIAELRDQQLSERTAWEARQGALQTLIDNLRQERFWPAEIQDEAPNPHQRLEAQLELTTQELDRERESIQRMVMDHNQLKQEIKRLREVSSSSHQECERFKSMLEKEVEARRRLMEENDMALETKSRLEEENEQIRLSHGKTQHDLAEMLKRLAAVDRKNQGANDASLMAQLREENEKLLETQKHLEQECMSLMDELVVLGNSESKGIEPWNREIEQLKTQVSRERKRYEDMEQALELKLERLNKELVDLESLVENKVFNETELEERLETERNRVRQLEVRVKEAERIVMIPTPTSPTYPLTEIYCEICEVSGHDLMLCTMLNDLSVGQSKSRNSYCVNCDVFDTHPTEQCPNQDETF
ncbi:hypothetical protein BY458DRAFT_571125 [Sporodiniella umbellata]|nr:hypothetical protein BY458DRAFT_571125 [Sporodiniella umbellata]